MKQVCYDFIFFLLTEETPASNESKGNKSPVEAANEIVELLKSARQISDDIQKNISTLPDLGEYPKINTEETEEAAKEEKKQ